MRNLHFLVILKDMIGYSSVRVESHLQNNMMHVVFDEHVGLQRRLAIDSCHLNLNHNPQPTVSKHPRGSFASSLDVQVTYLAGSKITYRR